MFRSVHDLPHAIVRVWQSVPITLDPPASRSLDRAFSNHTETSIPITRYESTIVGRAPHDSTYLLNPRPFPHLAQSSAHRGPRTITVWYSASFGTALWAPGTRSGRASRTGSPGVSYKLAVYATHCLLIIVLAYQDLGLVRTSRIGLQGLLLKRSASCGVQSAGNRAVKQAFDRH